MIHDNRHWYNTNKLLLYNKKYNKQWLKNNGIHSNTVAKLAQLELLPEKDLNFALEFIKKLVIAWDPDYTKVTSAERTRLEEAQREIENGETISHDAINWD